jgi:menaquinone-dependent protoporphyrinogen oxidase
MFRPILIIYATREGQTRHVAEHLAEALKAQQRESRLFDAAQLPAGFSMTDYSAAIVCASVHVGKHEREMYNFVKRHRKELQLMPAVFLSVSLSEAAAENPEAPAEQRAEARAKVQQSIETFLAKTNWRPTHIKAVAGALMYRRYMLPVRFMMRHIAVAQGMPNDTSKNHEFTDWADVGQWLKDLVESITPEMQRIG